MISKLAPFILWAAVIAAPTKVPPPSLDGRWIAVPESTPGCWYSHQRVRCGEKEIELKAPLHSGLTARDGIYLTGWTEDPVAPELQKVKDLIRARPSLFLSLTDLSLPEQLSLPKDLALVLGEADMPRVEWKSPWVIATRKNQVVWRASDSQGEWKSVAGEFLTLLSGDRALIFDGADHVSALHLKTQKTEWSVALPFEHPKAVSVGEMVGPLWELKLQDSASDASRSFWLNERLGAWVHSSPVKTAAVAAATTPAECPVPRDDLPRYSGLALTAATAPVTPVKTWCFDYSTLQWEQKELTAEKAPSPTWGADERVRFWTKWMGQVSHPTGLSVYVSSQDQVVVSSFFKTKEEIAEIEWYLQRLCGDARCKLNTTLRLLPSVTD